MPMDKKRYPENWKQIAMQVKEAFDTHKRTLTVAHLNHTPEDIRPENLMAMCAPCHLRYDAKHHAETRRKRNGDRRRDQAAAEVQKMEH